MSVASCGGNKSESQFEIRPKLWGYFVEGSLKEDNECHTLKKYTSIVVSMMYQVPVPPGTCTPVQVEKQNGETESICFFE